MGSNCLNSTKWAVVAFPLASGMNLIIALSLAVVGRGDLSL